MKRIFGVLVLLVGFTYFPSQAATSADAEKLTRMLQQSTLALLKEGNLRFVDGKSLHPNQEISRRFELATAGQEPMATVLACSDSRDPVEFIFDRGVGDLFVVRVAGNTAGLSELATMEYGVTHLGTPILIVMGHSQCGAVTAAVKGSELHGHLPALIALIKPAAEKAKISAPEAETVPRAIELNVWQQVENIFARSALIREAAAAGKVHIVGAVYDIAAGKVQWLGQHPELAHLLADAKAPTEPHAPVATAINSPSSLLLPAHAAPPQNSKPASQAATQKVSIPPSHRDPPPADPVTRAEVAAAHH